MEFIHWRSQQVAVVHVVHVVLHPPHLDSRSNKAIWMLLTSNIPIFWGRVHRSTDTKNANHSRRILTDPIADPFDDPSSCLSTALSSSNAY